MSERKVAEAPRDLEVDALARMLVDLAHPRLGSQAVAANDEFFAPKERLIDPAAPVFIPDKYDDNGKWMDGWESRRRRTSGHDWCVVRLGVAGRIHAFDIDTSHFTGNFPPEASIEAWHDGGTGREIVWETLVGRMDLKGNAHHLVKVDDDRLWTHLKLNIYPDGGVARLRVFGTIVKDWSSHDADDMIDLAAMLNGATAAAWNDAHFGAPANMLAPGKGMNMGDGWETARRRVPGNDWSVIKLARPGVISRAVVDTAYFKGNFPDRCSLQAAMVTGDETEEIAKNSENWLVIMTEQKLKADSEHVFEAEMMPHKPVGHVRLNIFPDGGVSRLRLFGKIAAGET